MLRVTNLSIDGILRNVSFELARGERLGIVGESGSGKSMTALAIMGLLPQGMVPRGEIRFDNTNLLTASDRHMRTLRGRRIAMIFQEPMTALDPMMTIGRQILEANPNADLAQLLSDVGLPGRGDSYPHELSGGQRQRVLIAKAIAGDPDILICDEPTTALDVTVQQQILTLIQTLATERSMSLIFISHDLGVISQMCDTTVVMKDGAILEARPTDQLLTSPEHPYTQALIAAARPKPPAARREHGTPLVHIDSVSTEHILDNVSLQVRQGERLGIVGGSGSGKTTLLRLIAGLSEPSSGSVTTDGSVQVVFQDPQSSLNPRLTIKKSIAEAGPNVSDSLSSVGLPEDSASRYPHEFSGGQRQRIAIARAIAGEPDILLADEPVSALDVTVRTHVLDLLNRLVTDNNLTLIFVSHDLSVVRELCDTVAVIHEGKIIEHGWTEDIWTNPQHPYTQRLLDAIPSL